MLRRTFVTGFDRYDIRMPCSLRSKTIGTVTGGA